MNLYALRRWLRPSMPLTYAVCYPFQAQPRNACILYSPLGSGLLWESLVRSAPLVQGNETSLNAPSVAEVPWDQRLLYRLFEGWISSVPQTKLGRSGSNSGDCGRSAKIKNNTNYYCLTKGSQVADHAVALYHWAKGTEILAPFLLQGDSGNPFSQVDKHFEAGARAATASGDAQREVLLLC